MQARDIMSSPVVTVTPDTTVKYAAKLLSAHGFTALPVLDADGRLIGDGAHVAGTSTAG
jgi:CBS domain-containing protein